MISTIRPFALLLIDPMFGANFPMLFLRFSAFVVGNAPYSIHNIKEPFFYTSRSWHEANELGRNHHCSPFGSQNASQIFESFAHAA